MQPVSPQPPAAAGRWAVAAIFFLNGFLTGSWAPQIPVFLSRLGISEFTLGLLILLFGIGAVAAMTWCGYLISLHGACNVLRAFGAAGTLGVLLVALMYVGLNLIVDVLYGWVDPRVRYS